MSRARQCGEGIYILVLSWSADLVFDFLLFVYSNTLLSVSSILWIYLKGLLDMRVLYQVSDMARLKQLEP